MASNNPGSRRLRDEAHALLWGAYQHAQVSGDHDEGRRLARRARALDQRADLLESIPPCRFFPPPSPRPLVCSMVPPRLRREPSGQFKPIHRAVPTRSKRVHYEEEVSEEPTMSLRVR
jgi:hypothetical protein